MEQSWRFRPMLGNICPTCSISHYPFCSRPPAFDRNGFGGDDFRRFPLENDQSFHRPFIDPFLDNRMVPPMHRSLSHMDSRLNSTGPVGVNPSDGYGSPQSWYRNQDLERYSVRPFIRSSQITDSAINGGNLRDDFQHGRFDHSDNVYMGGEFLEKDRIHKRMRVDGMGNGSSTQILPPYRHDYYSNLTRTSAEDERRLSLIRDHGITPNVPTSLSGFDSSFETGSDFASRPSGYLYESSLRESSRSGVDVPHANFDIHSKFPNDARTNNPYDSGFVSADRKGLVMHPERAYDISGHFIRDNDEKKELSSEEHGSGTRPQQLRSKGNGFISEIDHDLSQNVESGGKDAFNGMQNEQRMQSHYGQMENSANRFLQNYGPSNVPPVTPNYYDLGRQNQEPSTLNREEVYRYSSDDMLYPFPVGSNERYHTHDQHLRSEDFMPAKGPHYNHTSDWQMSSGSNMLHHEQDSNLSTGNAQLPQPYPLRRPVGSMHDHHSYGQKVDARQSFEVKPPPLADVRVPVGTENFSASTMNNRGYYLPISAENSMLVQDSQTFGQQPPLPPVPPPPPPVDPPRPPPVHSQPSTSPTGSSSLLRAIPSNSSISLPLAHQPAHEMQPSLQAYFHSKQHMHGSTGFVTEGSQIIHQTSSKQYSDEGKPFPVKHPSPDRVKVIDASHLFRHPHRATRPDHFVIILRGLPGSGKSYLAKMLRDLEVENGGDAPRIHSMDDYFMTEVEKVEESESANSSSSAKGKKRITKKVMEYCYEPEMEEAYRSSMLKAFKKTLEEGNFSFIIVDDRNLRVADFAQFWATAKRSGYEVFLLDAPYKDPMGCGARNVHGFTSDDIQKMADQWEEAPPLYLRVDIQSLFHGDNLNKCEIQEVDMDMEELACEEGLSGLQDGKSEKMLQPHGVDTALDGYSKDEERWDTEGDDLAEVKELRRSKWSHDVDEEEIEKTEGAKGNFSALSGLIQAYGKGDKSVHWGDQAGKTGFSIGAAKRPNALSLVIGPGSGYNLKSNPLPEEEIVSSTETSGEQRRCVFQEQLRAERESFRAVFDRRRQRISVLEMEDE
ncbi:uncharacterized protein LOC122670984 [Telopea speciosissima]|uniref:uncharacterized protein LOC122670984 n=1 Tax=Telopea speciosissima TaxID=54955 RepID=UPI001CC40907|nr:uncharacterized protein LOC122670984 [Telopea speciosissima]